MYNYEDSQPEKPSATAQIIEILVYIFFGAFILFAVVIGKLIAGGGSSSGGNKTGR